MDTTTQANENEEILPPLSEDDKMLAGLCYPFWFLFSPYVLYSEKKKELFLYFHSLQGLYYGALSTGFMLITFLFIYLVFFYRKVQNLASPSGQFDNQLTCGTLSIVALSVFFLVLVSYIFFLLWLGYKASTGIIFKLPVIGSIAYEKVENRRTRMEKEYLKYLTLSPEEREERKAEQSPATEYGPYPTGSGVPPGGIPEAPIREIKKIFETPAEEAATESAGETLQAQRKMGRPREIERPPQEEPQEVPETPPEDIPIEEQIAFLRKKYEQTHGVPPPTLEELGEMAKEESSSKTSFLKPEEQYRLLQKKYREISRGRQVPGQIKRQPGLELKSPGQRGKLSPLEKLRMKEAEQPQMSEEERRARARALMDRLEAQREFLGGSASRRKKQPPPGKLYEGEEEDDDIEF